MNLRSSHPERAPTGAAMDQPLEPQRRKWLRVALPALALLAAAGAASWQLVPRGLSVPAASVRIATVERGLFRDDVALRASAAPMQSVILDAVESGRVEEVQARDGATVQQGDPLFRLSNPQRRLELLQRESEHAQQISNLTNLRVNVEAGRAARQRRIADLDFALAQAGKQHARTVALGAQGFVSAVALEESADRLAQQRRLLEAERASNAVEGATQAEAVRQMEAAIGRLEAGLELVHSAIDALVVRAPVSGRLADFHLQVGETVTPGKHIGRIDDQQHYKLTAQVDEFHIARVTLGRLGSAVVDNRAYAVAVSRIYPQIKDGRFTVELSFSAAQPAQLSPGQGMEATITLGGSRSALLLPNDAFANDGGAAVYVLAGDGKVAARRAVRIGRRNNGQVEVLGGLVPGERVIVSSYSRYGAAERLRLAGPFSLSPNDMTQ